MLLEVSYNKYDRGHLIVPSDLPGKIKQAQSAQQELYQSVFWYDDDANEYANSNLNDKGQPSVSGYKGHCFIDTLLLDVDSVKNGINIDGNATYLKAKAVIEKLLKLNIKPYVIYFSGSGFHIEVFPFFEWKSSSRLPDMVTSLMTKMFPELDTGIYYVPSIIRSVNTINKKTFFYKIPLLIEEFMSMDYNQIKNLASVPRNDFGYPEPFDQPVVAKLEKKTSTFKEERKEYFREPSDVVTCVQHMYNQGPQEGSRHQVLMRIAAAWKRQGLPHKALESMALDWSTMKESETRKIVHDVFQKNYKWSCEDPVMAKYCDTRCMFHKHKNYIAETISMTKAEQIYAQHIRSIDSGKRIDIGLLYGDQSFAVDSGSVCAIMGDTGLGKSSLAMDIALKANVPTLYISIEMGQILTYRRFVQAKYGLKKEEVEDHYRTNSNSYSQGLSHIEIVHNSPTMEEIKKMVRQYNPRLVMIDTLNTVRVPNVYDETQKSALLAPALKDLALSQDIIIMPIVHISKAAAQDEKGKQKHLTVHSIKGSSTQEQAFDMVLGWEGSTHNISRVLRTLKSRDESPIVMQFEIDFDTFQLQLKGYGYGQRQRTPIKQSFGNKSS